MSFYGEYPRMPDFENLTDSISQYSQLKHEHGAKGVQALLSETEKLLKDKLDEIIKLSANEDLARKEPDDLKKIQSLRPEGPRRFWQKLNEDFYTDKLYGALYSRLAGCILGSIVEFWPVEEMEKWARHIGDSFPPQNYWSQALKPYNLKNNINKRSDYTSGHMDGCPVDDDIMYTLLGLLIVEDYGVDFTVGDTAKAWLKYLPYACTAEDIALNNLKKGIDAKRAGAIANPCNQWIGADIRSDSFAYIAPGYPEKAASMAYNDAYISHRRNGIYGEMFFAAVQSAAFVVDNPIEALKIGLTEIPKDCILAKEIKWAFEAGKEIHNYKQARDAVDERYKGMNPVHTINNAVLTVWGLMIGRTDVTKVISETVAMGLDNDCTAATAGSIVGAIAGKKNVPEYWYKPFNNKIYSYLIGHEVFMIDDIVSRFKRQAEICLP